MEQKQRKRRRVANLKTLFELRRTVPLTKRTVAGRLFVYQNKWGLVDSTGILFPITNSFSLEKGDMVVAWLEAHLQEGKENYLFEIREILEHHPFQGGLPQPLGLPPILPDLSNIKIRSTTATCFYHLELQQRFSRLALRHKALERILAFFSNRNFLHVDTPILVRCGGMETYMEPFQTQYTDWRGRNWTFELPTSPEFSLKKILSEGAGPIFQIAKVFRNGGELGPWHEPEFTMLEWYRKQGKLRDILEDTQLLVEAVLEVVPSALVFPKQWNTHRVDDLFKNLCGLRLEDLQQAPAFYQAAQGLSPSLRPEDDWPTLFSKLFMERIEPFLKEEKACFVTHYPIQLGALASREWDKHSGHKKPYVQRGEVYLQGVELSNGYQELVDFQEFKERLEERAKQKPLHWDSRFEEAMAQGIPPCAGNALGVERLLAILTESPLSEWAALPLNSQISCT